MAGMPHNIPHVRALYIRKRALYIRKRALYIRKRALYIRKKDNGWHASQYP